jgi:hypothetical protein
MGWAARRRFLILLILGLVAAAFFAVVYIAAIYKAPTCFDGVQNGTETGIDCGGACARVCTAEVQPPTVLFTQAFPNGIGGTNVVAEVSNQNATAEAKAVPYTLSLFGADQSLVGKTTGTVDLPPGARVPIFVPGLQTGNQVAAHSFLSIDPDAPLWTVATRDPRIVPQVSNIVQGGTLAKPQITATLTNPSTTVLSQVLVVVLVRDASGNVINASQTVVPSIPSLGSATALFTWNDAFTGTPASTEVLPVIPLP